MRVYLSLLKFQKTLARSAVRVDKGWITLRPHLHMTLKLPYIIICDSICQRTGYILPPIQRIAKRREPQLPLTASHAHSAILVSTTPLHPQSHQQASTYRVLVINLVNLNCCCSWTIFSIHFLTVI